MRTAAMVATVALALGLATSNANAGGKKNKTAAAKFDPSTLVWPPPPMEARIKYMATYTGLSDFAAINKKKSGWLEKMAGIAGEQGGGSMVKPYGVAVDSKGRIFVTDTARSAIFIFDTEKHTVETWGQNPGTEMQLPTGIAIDEQDRVFFTESYLHRINCFSPDGKRIAAFGTDKVSRAAGLAIDSTLRRLYVADTQGHRVAVFDLDTFKFLKYIGKTSTVSATEPGTFFGPTNIAIDPDGLVYVVDSFINRVQVFDPEGECVREFGRGGLGAGAFQRAKGIAIDMDGNIYVSDATSANVQMLDKNGEALLPIGSMGTTPGRFFAPAGVTYDKFQRLIVVDQQAPRIQVFRYISEAEITAAKEKKAATTQAAK